MMAWNYGKMVLTIKIDPMRVMELQIDLTELFEPENFLERIQCIGMEQNKCLPVV